jgi:RNase P/RNase MRP subunit POP5
MFYLILLLNKGKCIKKWCLNKNEIVIFMKAKLNPIPKTKRENKRYLLLEVLENKQNENMQKVIFGEIINLFGTNGFAEISPRILKSEKKNKIILKIKRDSVDNMKAIINCINIFSNIKINILKTSGTLKSLSSE